MKNTMHDCYWCESMFDDILDLIAHIKEMHKPYV
jgi:hypothetical protein